MTFLSGFVEGFTNERKRRLDREAEKEDQVFQYQLKSLTDKKSQRDKRKLEETQWANQAKIAAKEMGDPSFATEAYNYLSSGRSLDQILDDVRSGNFQKDPSYKQPTKTIQMDLPGGVANTEMEEGDTGYKDPMVSSRPTQVAQTAEEKVDPRLSKANQRIDELDPDLRRSAQEPTNSEYVAGTDSGWLYKKRNEIKLPAYKDSLMKVEVAKQRGDTAAMRDALTEVRIQETAMAQEAAAKAKAEGKNVAYYMPVGPDGVVGNLFAGEVRSDSGGDRALFNVSNPLREEAVSTNVIRLDDNAVKEYQNLATQFDKTSSDYNARADQYLGALATTSSIKEILDRNPSVTTMAATGVGLANSLTDEVKGAYRVLLNQEDGIEKAIKGGNVEELEQKVNQYERDVQTMLSQPNKDLAFDKAMYDSLRKLSAYKFAAANGIGSRDLSNRDYENFYEATGGNKSPSAVMAGLYNNAASVFSVLDSSRITLDNNNAVKTFEKTYLQGKKSGLIPDRIEDKIRKMAPEQADKILPIFKTSYQTFKTGTKEAVRSELSNEQKEPTKPQTQTGIPEGAIQMLKSDPQKYRKFFEQKYGQSADQFLGD